MYCQFCGAEAAQELNYCKRCGGSLNPLASAGAQEISVRPAVSPLSVWGIGITTLVLVIGGLIVLFGFMMEMARNGFPPPALAWLAILGALTILGSVALLTRLWKFVLGGSSTQSAAAPRSLPLRQLTNELPPHRIEHLPNTPATPASVTEHTTRTFERK
jgi:hypothetical protein